MPIKQHHNQSEQLHNLLKVATWKWDIHLNHVDVSDSLYEMFGVKKVAIDNVKRFTDLIHSEDKDFYHQTMDQAFEDKTSFFIEYRIVKPDGQLRIIQEKCDFILNEQNEVIGMTGALIDVTELKRPASSFQLDYPITLADRKTIYGHWEWDIVNEKLYLSSEASLIFGLDPNATHTYDQDILINLVHTSDYERVYDALTSALTLGYINIEYLTNTATNHTAIVHINGEMIRDDNHKPMRMLGTVRNISALMQKEKVKLQTEKLSVLSQLAAGVAHEILNPLTSVSGFIKLIKNTDNVLKESYVNIMEKEIQQVEFIVNELLMLAKPRISHLSNHHLQDILDRAILILKDEIRQNEIDIQLDIDSQLPKVKCEGNQVRQLFINLIRNAMESMEAAGTIFISIKKISANKIKIIIDDEGCGIPGHLLTKAGEPFYTTKEKGTGLGLMVCYRIVENHKGNITLHRKKDKGTKVKIILPINY